MHLLANRLSFFFGIKIHLLYFFLPRSSRKNAHSLLRYFGIRGTEDTSFVLPNCRFAPETQKRPKPFPAVCFWGDFWVFVFDYKRLSFGGGILTVRHSKAAVCRFRVTKKRRISTTLLSCSAYFVAGVLGIPLVHYVEERGEVVILWFVAVHAVIDCNKAYLLLGEQNLGIKADLKIVSAETAHILDDNCADFPGFGFCKHCLKSGTVEVTPCVTVIFQKIVCKKFVILKIHINCNLCYSIEK